MVYTPKICIRISKDVNISTKTITNMISVKYKLNYCALYREKEYICIYLHGKTKMASKYILEIFEEKNIEIKSVSGYSTFVGELFDEDGEIPKHGGSRTKYTKNNIPIQSITNIQNINNINVIMVNPMGQETLKHITSEYIQKLLENTEQDANVIFKFGTKLYSIPENMNFISSLKDGYVKALVPGSQRAWITGTKEDVFETIVENLSSKNQEAVELYMSDIPKEHIEKFKRNISWINEFRHSYISDEQLCYKRFRNQGLNALSENISDKKRRISRDDNSNLQLV